MATEKTAKANSIQSARSRAGLAARREPYWYRVEAGAFVGYRVLTEGKGTWTARWRDPFTGKQHYRALGTYPEGKDATGKTLDAFGAASKDAREWFAGCAAGVTPKRSTVLEICLSYVEALRVTKGPEKAASASAYFRRLIEGDPIANVDVDRLQADHLQKWRERISKPQARVGRGSRLKKGERAQATINRDIVPLRAALNLALERGIVASDMAWRGTLKPIKGADRRRDVYLSVAERRGLVEKASAEFAQLVKMLCLLPLRPGAAAGLRVGGYDKRTNVLTVGNDKGEEHARKVKLPVATAEFVEQQCKGKLPTAFMFTDAAGAQWTKDTWKKSMRAAMTAAEIRPDAVLYSIRHSVITDLVTSGLDLLTIAQISGTSVLMIEKHYGHLRHDHAANGLAVLAI